MGHKLSFFVLLVLPLSPACTCSCGNSDSAAAGTSLAAVTWSNRCQVFPLCRLHPALGRGFQRKRNMENTTKEKQVHWGQGAWNGASSMTRCCLLMWSRQCRELRLMASWRPHRLTETEGFWGLDSAQSCRLLEDPGSSYLCVAFALSMLQMSQNRMLPLFPGTISWLLWGVWWVSVVEFILSLVWSRLC